MENESVFGQQMTKEILMQWLDKKKFLSSKHKSKLFEIGCDCLDDVSTLYNINKAIVEKQKILTVEDAELIFKIEDNVYTLIYQDEKLEFKESELKEVITAMIDILETIYPLGTVIDLKKEYLNKHINANEIDNIRIVITHRFLYSEGDKAYFPYAGVTYPVGMFDRNQVINFTNALIEKVVQKGYSDMQEEAYVYLMKRELILHNEMHSFGFSTEEDRNNLKNKFINNQL